MTDLSISRFERGIRMNILTRFRAACPGAFAWTAALLALSACSSGEFTEADSEPVSQSCSATANCGAVFVGLTDAAGDFLSYTVDVASLTLRRPSGTNVEVLPSAMRVDFAQNVDLIELFSAATIPVGTYVGGTLRLDFRNADITVEVDGLPVAASPVDADGEPLGVIDINVTLEHRNRLTIAPLMASSLTLDFDLAATNTVDTSVMPPLVTVTPALIASLQSVDEKSLRLRGTLVSVDAHQALTSSISIRPAKIVPARSRERTHCRAHAFKPTHYVNGAAGLNHCPRVGRHPYNVFET